MVDKMRKKSTAQCTPNCGMLGQKAQLKIQQMAFMLMAVTIFFVLVGMFVLVIKFAGVKESAKEIEEKNAILLSTKLANSPEFSCGESFGSGKINCIDLDKVIILRENIVNYLDFWGVDNIEIRTIAPESVEKMCNMRNYPNCNIIRVRPQEITAEYSNFVSLCRKESFEGEVYNKCELGKLIISYEVE